MKIFTTAYLPEPGGEPQRFGDPVADRVQRMRGQGTVFDKTEDKIHGSAVKKFRSRRAAVTEDVVSVCFPVGQGKAETEFFPRTGPDGILRVTQQLRGVVDGLRTQKRRRAVIKGIEDPGGCAGSGDAVGAGKEGFSESFLNKNSFCPGVGPVESCIIQLDKAGGGVIGDPEEKILFQPQVSSG